MASSNNSPNKPNDVTALPDDIRLALACASSSSDSSEVEGSSCPQSRVQLTDVLLDRLTQQANYWKQWFDSSGSESQDSTNGSSEVRSQQQVIIPQPQSWPSQLISAVFPAEMPPVSVLTDARSDSLLGAREDSRDALNFADSETDSWDSTSSGLKSDSELELDKWPCHQCGTPTSAVSRYCLRCFQVRRNWLPKRTKLGGNNSKKRKHESEQSEGSELETVSAERLDTVSKAREEHEFLRPEPKRLKLDTDNVVLGKKQKKEESSQPSMNYCDYCCVREKDAAFVHNHIAHRCCCFPCADKILKKTGKCPICRERILRVVKVIVV